MHHQVMRIRTVTTCAVLAGSVLVASCAPVNGDPVEPDPTSNEYVAMGSSFAAGAGIGALKPASPERCGRTVNNYPTLLAARLKLSLDDQTCAGATSAHVVSSWNELPAQIDAVTAATRLVTVTLGGNDLNYVGNLFMASCTPGETVRVGKYDYRCVAPQPPSDEDYAKLERGLREIVRQVNRRAPDAQLVLVQYLALVPDKPCAAANLSNANARLTRRIGNRLAEITARIAQSTGALLLEADKLSRNHDPCDEHPWANGMTQESGLSQGAPWHPNARGHRAIAEALSELLQP